MVARDVLSLEHQAAREPRLTDMLWRGRWLILACVLACGVLAAIYSLLAREWYAADVVVAPAGVKSAQALPSQLAGGGLGLLSGLAGLALGGPHTAEPLGVLRSRGFARQFIEEQGLLHVLLADKWNARTGHWKESDPRKQPDVRDAIDYFTKNIMQVIEDKKTGLITVRVQWTDPAAAALWADKIVERINDQMRNRALAEAEGNVAFLQKELAETSVIEVKQAVAKLLENELQKVMAARGDRQYAFRVVDAAEVPKHRAWPRRRVVVAVGMLLGGLVGALWALFRERRRSSAMIR
ncbi:MAG: hypothetical protein JOZ03_03920 [Gammaproteobacteria bacterium]|nr:hypothetical protein [Gammaproteobacteria bacterium]